MAAAPVLLRAGMSHDGGGRDVSVALFSTRTVRGVTLTPVGTDAWVASCAKCVRKKLTSAVRFAGPGDLFAGGALRLTEDASGEVRQAAGLWHVRAEPDGCVDVVLTLPSERYVAAVLNAEAAAEEPRESLSALAIAARTYALNGRHYTPQPGHMEAELCDSTQCLATRLEPVRTAVAEAVRATAGETLWYGPNRAEVFFSQSCGGMTEDAGAVWPHLGGLPYLKTHPDPYCIRQNRAAWHTEVSLAELAAIGQDEGWHLPERIVAARVEGRDASRRALRVALRGEDGRESVVAASALRFAVGRTLGWSRIRSDAYEVSLRDGALVFDGRGHGHGVGLCQEGATEMATEGKDARAILAFYFPGTQVRITPHDAGWRETRVGAMTVRSAADLTEMDLADVRGAWDEARRRFAPRSPVAPEVTFAPTTEVFRQLTGQPGWALGSTQGNRIVLQPESVPRRRGHETLVHEMLHVLVESEIDAGAAGRAPLWLREGVVEVLAGETSPPAAMSSSQVEAALAHADSLAASERAHRAAGSMVRAAMARYGASVVRGWLSSGPPPELAAPGAR
jgi:stage II sporulation protein D